MNTEGTQPKLEKGNPTFGVETPDGKKILHYSDGTLVIEGLNISSLSIEGEHHSFYPKVAQSVGDTSSNLEADRTSHLRNLITGTTEVVYTDADHFGTVYSRVYEAIINADGDHETAHDAALSAWDHFNKPSAEMKIVE